MEFIQETEDNNVAAEMTQPSSIAHYRITSKLGEGGMGAVYRATDTKLDREVAIKILPDALARDPDRLARFEREAKVLAALNHPNIAQIYGVEERALIMELVPGKTLHGPIPIHTVLNYARQIAEALEAAHEKGIIHRDLKPANVIVTPDGVVKVLDFGLAAAPHAAPGPENSSTLTMPGVIMGTPAYMSPEQASGAPIDKRSDIWSFGVVLFEMLTGKPLFGGKTVADTLAQVLAVPIDFANIPKETPRVLRDLLRRCLTRDLKMRLSHIAEARIALQDGTVAEEVAAPARSKTAWVVATAAILIAAITGFGWWKATQPVERPLVQIDAELGPDVSLGSVAGADVIISPDGASLVFVSKGRLFTRRLNQSYATELAGTDGAFAPFFSPDGQWVAFFNGSKLKKISVEGGAAVTLCDAPGGRGGAWGENGTIVAALTTSTSGALSTIPDGGGAPQPLTELAQGEISHRWPQFLPGSKAVLFTASTTVGVYDGASIEVMSLPDRRRKTIQRGGMYGRYLAASNGSGHLVYINRGTLFAIRFDPDTLALSGAPAAVAQKVSYNSNTGSAQFDFSQDGTLVYRSGGAGGLRPLQWLSSGGKLQSLLSKPGAYGQPRLSPDGKLLALTVANAGGSDIWTYDWQRDLMSKVSFGDGNYSYPAWSPDGRYLAFHTDSGIFWARADGVGKPQPLTQSKEGQFPGSFSADGRRLAFTEYASSSADIWTVPVEDEGSRLRAGTPEVFLQTPVAELSPAFSPDGRWIAYQSNESGIPEIHVRAFPDKGGRRQISNTGGAFAIWSRNGRELFYQTLDHQIMVVSYTVIGDSFVPEKPNLWSAVRLADTGHYYQNLDISPDGNRFIVLMPVEAAGQQRANNQVTFLLNFADELRRRTARAK